MLQVTEKVIRLINNTLLIGRLITNDEDDSDFILFEDSVEITFDEFNQMIMKKWMSVSYNGDCDIAIDKILAIAEPNIETLTKYHETIYDTENLSDVKKIY